MNAALEQRVPHPGACLAAGSHVDTAVPLQLTRFVGRSTELLQISELLGSTRLLTLTGPGGSGKTRLAIEVARAVERGAAAHVWWVEMASLTDPSLVSQEVAAALRLVEEPGRSPTQALMEAIGLSRALLVLDNCEHVVEACALLSDQLLRSCPNLTVLASSREALGIAGETAWLVPPLSLPPLSGATSADLLERSEAVALFVERARAVAPAFGISDANAAAVAAICRRLDGIPLALELAAARIKVLSPAQILDRLDDCFSLLVQRGRTTLARHQTIRAAIDWSYHLLQPCERLLLQRLSIFAGGFSLEAAEQVCAGEEIDSRDVLDVLAALVERSLVVMREQEDNARYHLLEVVRQYAVECLDRNGSERGQELARRHAEFFAGFAEAAAPGLDVLMDPTAMASVAAEHDNLRAGLDWALRSAESPLALRISSALWPHWLHGTHWSDGLESMAKVLAGADPAQLTPEYGRAALGAGSLAYAMHDLRRAQSYLVEAERVWKSLSNARYLALVNQNLAQIYMHLGEHDTAVEHADVGEMYAREAGDPCVLAYCLATGRGFVHAFRGEADVADRACAEAQEIALRVDYQWGVLVASFSRAMTAWMHGDEVATALHAAPCVTAARRLGHAWFVPRVLLVAAAGIYRLDPIQAARLLGACDALQFSSRGGRLLPVEQPHFVRIVHAVRSLLEGAAYPQAWTAGGMLGLEGALDEAAASLGRVGVSHSADPHSADPHSADPHSADPHSADPHSADPHMAVVGASPEQVPAEHHTSSPARALPRAELCVRALGPLEIGRGDELLGTERWSYARPRELLLFLLCNRAGATKEQIGQAIWPEATPPQVRNNLHVTLHYVRKVLGSSDWIVYAEDRYRVHPERSIEFDVETFEDEACTILRDGAAVDDDRLRRALTHYRGDFLSGELFGSWHYEWRDRALNSYVALLALLADRCLGRHEYGEATRLYQQLITREELREDFHRGYMQCLARTGARARALRHGEHLARLLREELDAEPEPETTALCERLRRAEGI
jgi:predicted ATPase/DNA-binding SARP family transcriptional activator